MNEKEFKNVFSRITDFKENRFHPLVWIVGEPEIDDGVYIGGFSELNCKDAKLRIGKDCDIASFVSINCADSHHKCLGISRDVQRVDITLEENVFVGSFSVIKGGAHIAHHSVIAAGTIVDSGYVPPYSLVAGNPMVVKKGYYSNAVASNSPQ